MDTFLANLATFIVPVCTFLCFAWIVAIKKPHDEEEKHNREMLKAQMQSFTEAMNRLEKRAFEAIYELKEAITKLTSELVNMQTSKERMEARLNTVEKQTETNSQKIQKLADRIMDGNTK